MSRRKMIDKVYKFVIENDYDLGMTAVRNLDFRIVCQILKIKTAVEIGTFHGATAAYISQFANKVHTFDIRNLYDRHTWEKLGLAKRIEFHLVKDRTEIAEILKDIEFDFAFIDDDHSEKVKDSFDLVKRSGRVLFHDIEHPKFPEVSKFIDKIGARRLDRNGYWMEGI
jgi:predicted O-methyltransferase YrrM